MTAKSRKHTWTTWNRKNEADLTYLGMREGILATRATPKVAVRTAVKSSLFVATVYI